MKDVSGDAIPTTCGCSSVVERQPSKLECRRFESDHPLSGFGKPEFIPSINISPFVIILQKVNNGEMSIPLSSAGNHSASKKRGKN